MKRLLLAALMIFTMTSIYADVGENSDTNCAEMVDANRNATDNGAVEATADTVTEEAANQE